MYWWLLIFVIIFFPGLFMIILKIIFYIFAIPFYILKLIEPSPARDSAKKIYSSSNTTQGNFIIALLFLFAEVMKTDGRVMKSELNYVKDWLVLNFGESKAQECLKILKGILNQTSDLYKASEKINASINYSNRLQLIHCLFGIALADGEVSREEIYTIEKIANLLRISSADYTTVQNMYFKNADSAYKILQVEKSATDEEIKKAYKKLCIKYHPDKVAHLGEEVQKAANEKFQKINEAFETIKKERNIN